MPPDSASSPATRLFFLSFKELWRNRFGLLLLFVIPPVFLGIVEWTSGEATLPIELYYRTETSTLLLTQRAISVVFIGAAVSGFLTAYYAILLFHRNFNYFRHCIAMGLAPSHFVGARVLFFLAVVLVLALFMTLIVGRLVTLENPGGTFVGFVLMGTVYGSFGGVIGLVSRDFMVAILWIVLLANLDAGWLQNPVFYSTAQETEIIKWLPAFHPTQVVLSSAFSDNIDRWAAVWATAYSALLVASMLVVVRLRLRSVGRWWT